MTLRAWLDGQPMDGLDPRVRLTEIREEAPRTRAVTLPSLRGGGLRLVRLNRESLSVTLLIDLHESDPAERQALLDRLNRWAGDGVKTLRLSTRPDRLLRCVCDGAPGVRAADWTAPAALRLTAWTIPYWQAAEADTLTLEGPAAAGTLWLRGTAESVLEAAVTALEPLDSLRIASAGEAIRLTGLGLAVGDRLVLGHDDAGLLTLRAFSGGAERSVLACREADSADEISLTPGGNPLTLVTDGAARAELRGRGRWR